MLKKMLRWSAVAALLVAIVMGVNAGGLVLAEKNAQEATMGGVQVHHVVVVAETRYSIGPDGILKITSISAGAKVGMSDERLQQLYGEVISNKQLDQLLKATDPSKVQRSLLSMLHEGDSSEMFEKGNPIPPGAELPPGPPEGFDTNILP